jgi:citrate lyase beta subunit
MSTVTVSPLRQRMIEDMNARKLCAGTQRGHIHSCKRFAAFLKRSPDTAAAEDIRRFQLHLSETGASICNRNRIMTGVRFLFRVTLRRLDLARPGGCSRSRAASRCACCSVSAMAAACAPAKWSG